VYVGFDAFYLSLTTEAEIAIKLEECLDKCIGCCHDDQQQNAAWVSRTIRDRTLVELDNFLLDTNNVGMHGI